MAPELLFQLRQALEALDAAARHSADCRPAVERLDALVRESGPALDPELRHFLLNRSYGKAFRLVEGAGAVERGTCGS